MPKERYKTKSYFLGTADGNSSGSWSDFLTALTLYMTKGDYGMRPQLIFIAGSELNLADNIECFWLSSPVGSAISETSKSSQQLAAAMDVTTSLANNPTRCLAVLQLFLSFDSLV